MLGELDAYQQRLRDDISLSLSYDKGMGWTATIQTKCNAHPYWQASRAATPDAAWAALRSFLDGGPQLHGRTQVKASDFLASGGTP